MPNLIKNKQVIENTWHIISSQEALACSNTTDKLLISIELWEIAKERYSENFAKQQLGLYIQSHESYTDVPEDYQQAPVIAINFPVFTDGRAYSIARDLRQKLNYQGELRAVGDVLHDQLGAMMRCGFDAFLLVDNENSRDHVEKALLAFDDFSAKYQSDSVESKPVYQR